VNVRTVAEIEAHRLHDVKRGAGQEDIRGRRSSGICVSWVPRMFIDSLLGLCAVARRSAA
jgi:hypothetical protein